MIFSKSEQDWQNTWWYIPVYHLERIDGDRRNPPLPVGSLVHHGPGNLREELHRHLRTHGPVYFKHWRINLLFFAFGCNFSGFQVTGLGEIPLKVLKVFLRQLKTNLNVSGGWSKQGNHYPIPGKMCGRWSLCFFPPFNTRKITHLRSSGSGKLVTWGAKPGSTPILEKHPELLANW